MNTKLHDENVDFLFDAILTLKNREECYKFFEDLCTVPELKAMSQRIAVAKMLSERHVYSDIVDKTGASTATRGLYSHYQPCQSLFELRQRRLHTDF